MKTPSHLILHVDRRSKIKQSTQIETDLKPQIVSSKLPHLTKLPSFDRIAKDINLPLEEIHLAFQNLVVEGHLIYQDGNYYTYIQTIKDTGIFGMKSLYDTIVDSGHTPRFETIEVEEVIVNEKSPLRNVFSKGDTLIRYIRVYYANEVPSFILESYLSKSTFNVPQEIIREHFVYHYLYHQFQIVPSHAKRYITVEQPSEQVNRLLHQTTSSSVLKVESTNYDQHGNIIDLSILWTSMVYTIHFDQQYP